MIVHLVFWVSARLEKNERNQTDYCSLSKSIQTARVCVHQVKHWVFIGRYYKPEGCSELETVSSHRQRLGEKFTIESCALDKCFNTFQLVVFWCFQPLWLLKSSFPSQKCANLRCIAVCVARKLQVIYSTNKQKPSQTLIYPAVCVGESTKQQRGDDVPRQTLCSVGGLLNALTGSHRKRALHLSTPSFLHPSLLPSLSLPPDSNSAGKGHRVVPTPHIHYQSE